MSLSTIFNDYWLLILIVIHSIHRYIICKSFINVDFILVPYYMIHDIIYLDLIIFNNFRHLRFFWNPSLIMSNESFGIFTFSIRSSCILAPFLIQEFFIFGTNRSTTLQTCPHEFFNLFFRIIITDHVKQGNHFDL